MSFFRCAYDCNTTYDNFSKSALFIMMIINVCFLFVMWGSLSNFERESWLQRFSHSCVHASCWLAILPAKDSYFRCCVVVQCSEDLAGVKCQTSHPTPLLGLPPDCDISWHQRVVGKSHSFVCCVNTLNLDLGPWYCAFSLHNGHHHYNVCLMYRSGIRRLGFFQSDESVNLLIYSSNQAALL